MSVYLYILPFLLSCFLIYRRRDLKTTLDELLGKSQFQIGKWECVKDLSFLVVATLVIRMTLKLSSPAIRAPELFSYEFFRDVLMASFSEELLFRGVLMRALKNTYGENSFKPFLLNVAIFVSFHNLRFTNYYAVLLLGILLAISYRRFSSVNICILLHFLWNFCRFV
jgi:membrane protease YdiL (CAAX protease family)